jgi:bifunctional non-homologous end joining protein LigD
MASLKDYQEKRRFADTPEPRGKVKASKGNSFVVQEHHARRLHYDFRLEIDGVLKSWAVPKGPSLNPSDKRLAVRTEDHPLEYGKFHGEIPAGHYGAGQVSIWDSGTFEMEGNLSASEQLARGELKLILHGRKLAGSFVLVKIRGKEGKEWLLIKHSDAAADPKWTIENAGEVSPAARAIKRNPDLAPGQAARPAKARAAKTKIKLPAGARKAPMPSKIQAALASIADAPFSSPDWIFEIKWDGVRTLANVFGNKVRLWARSGREISREYPELLNLADALNAEDAWVDGEIVTLDAEGRSDFQHLQARMGQQKPSAQLIEQVPVYYYVFDLLYLNGHDLRGLPLIERKKLLREILDDDPRVRYSDHVVEKGKELYELAASRGLEGILAKKSASVYPEKRSSAWLKIKLYQDLDAVIGGWTDPRGSREHFGALAVGLYDGDRLEFIGGVGSGYDGETQKRVWDELQKRKMSKSPFATPPDTREQAHWVKPELVARVKFGGWTDGRHLRQPTFLGLQEDRDAEGCTFDEQMKSAIEPPTESPEVARAKRASKARWQALRGSKTKSRAEAPAATAVSKAAAPAPVVAASPAGTVADLSSDAAIEQELNGGSRDSVYVDVDGRRLRFTNLNKIYFPGEKLTKRDLLAHYWRVAPLILPFLKDRPLVLRRFPNGIEGKPFFQKDAGAGTPEWVKTVPIDSEGKGKTIDYIVANDRATLLYLTNLGCIDENPWSSRYTDMEHPDYVFIDLDPTEGASFATVINVAKIVLSLFEKVGMKVYAKTSGARGIHIFLPLEPRYTYEQARIFVETIASLIVRKHPGLLTPERSVSKRVKGTIHIDSHQNSRGQSLASVYSVRAYPHGPVSTPLRMKDVTEKLRPEQFNLKTIPARLEEVGNLWKDFWKNRQRLETLLEQRKIEV